MKAPSDSRPVAASGSVWTIGAPGNRTRRGPCGPGRGRLFERYLRLEFPLRHPADLGPAPSAGIVAALVAGATVEQGGDDGVDLGHEGRPGLAASEARVSADPEIRRIAIFQDLRQHPATCRLDSRLFTDVVPEATGPDRTLQILHGAITLSRELPGESGISPESAVGTRVERLDLESVGAAAAFAKGPGAGDRPPACHRVLSGRLRMATVEQGHLFRHGESVRPVTARR